MQFRLLGSLFIVLFFFLSHAAADFTRTEDVIYGRKYAMALTMDVFQPVESNGVGIVFAVSGGWFSHKGAIDPGNPFIRTFLNRGYTVFAVLHGSQPKFTIPEITEDMHRAVRFIRHNASDYGIDPDQIGVTGGSAGGHLSLTLATQGRLGDANAEDPVDLESSAVQAVACLFPPTDFLNYGGPGEDGVGVGILHGFQAAFGPRADDPKERKALGREISPIYFVTEDLPPVLIIHGDADELVPLQQAESFVQQAKESGAEVELMIKPGEGHGWPDFEMDFNAFADWFDRHLR